MTEVTQTNQMTQSLLSQKNAHVRDIHIQFEEIGHKYSIKGDKSFTSVTTWLKKFFRPFNGDIIIDRMMASPKWPMNKYYGMTKQEIKNLWRQNGDEAARLGTAMHKSIEDFYNGEKIQYDSFEMKCFEEFVLDHPLVPYRTEWTVYDEELKLCGSIDMTFMNEDGTLSIYDWKRCKSIEIDSDYNKYALPPIQTVPDTNYWHYTIQLNAYKTILERNYGFKVKELVLICIHPELDITYKKFVVPFMDITNLYEKNE
jgi:ATP-dependent exoDNAse (exonuclease V) beta subunit